MLNAGDQLWNGAIVTEQLARAYNAMDDKIKAIESTGRKAPDNLLDGRHNLINSARGGIMYKVIAESGDPNGELISEHGTIEQAQGALLDAIETDAENLLWYGIDGREEPPTYAEAMEYARDFFYIVEERDNG